MGGLQKRGCASWTFFAGTSCPHCHFSLDLLYFCLESFNPALLNNFYLIGDFNVNVINPLGSLFCQLSLITNSFCLTQVVTSPTHISPTGQESLIDLALLSEPTALITCTILPPVASSDHRVVSLRVTSKSRHPRSKRIKRKVWQYTKADFGKAKTLILSTDWNACLCSSDIDVAWTNWKVRFLSIMVQSIPSKTILYSATFLGLAWRYYR